MRRHSRPYQPKKKWQKKMPKTPLHFEQEVLVRTGKSVELVTYVMKLAEGKCTTCECEEEGRVFKVLKVENMERLVDWEPQFIPHEVFSRIQRQSQGKIFCLDCLPAL